jgi:hypothetical protein
MVFIRGEICFFVQGLNKRRLSFAFTITLRLNGAAVKPLTAFGLFAVMAMLIFYALEKSSPWFIFAFAIACALGSIYGFLQGAWPFGVVEAIWSVVALRRWRLARTRK